MLLSLSIYLYFCTEGSTCCSLSGIHVVSWISEGLPFTRTVSPNLYHLRRRSHTLPRLWSSFWPVCASYVLSDVFMLFTAPLPSLPPSLRPARPRAVHGGYAGPHTRRRSHDEPCYCYEPARRGVCVCVWARVRACVCVCFQSSSHFSPFS